MSKFVTIYTVKRIPVTAGAKNSAGYSAVEFEYLADTGREALDKAIKDCEWRDPTRNFAWRVTGTKVVEVSSE